MASTWRAWAASRRPGTTGTAAGTGRIEPRGALAGPRYSGTSKGIPGMRAGSAITSGSPTMTTRRGKASRARSAHRSGPMPAGSPAVSATSGVLALVVAVLDEGAVARLAQPVLVRLVGLARADRLARRELLPVARQLVRTALGHLHQVPAEGRLHRLAHFLVLQRVHDALQLPHAAPPADPPPLPPLRPARPLR